jgi:hypothetical protein
VTWLVWVLVGLFLVNAALSVAMVWLWGVVVTKLSSGRGWAKRFAFTRDHFMRRSTNG